MADRPDMSLIEEIDRLASSEQFVPYVITMASRQQYAIEASDFVAVGRGVIFITRHRRGYHVLRQGQVTEVSVPGEVP